MAPKNVKRHGAGMLKGLTKDLYENVAMVCREYISNAADIKAETINIEVLKPGYDSIIFADDGPGMTEEEIEEATNIMISSKEYVPEYPPIGKFGIGLYAGGMVCEEIHITTKKEGEPIVRVVKIPIADWFHKGETDLSLDINDVTVYDYEEEEIDPSDEDEIQRSYTIIELHKLRPFAVDYLKNKENELIEEIARNSPIKLDYNNLQKLSPLDFQDDLDNGIPENILENGIVDWIRARVETSNHCDCGLTPQYNNLKVFFNSEEINRPVPQVDYVHPTLWKELTIYDTEENPIGYAWAAHRDLRITNNNRNAQLGGYKERSFQGISLRLWNVLVTPCKGLQAVLDIPTQSAKFPRWWGEIYLMDPDIKLNLNRTKISEESPNWATVKDQLRVWIRRLQRNSEDLNANRKGEIWDRIEVLKERGFNPTTNFLNDLRSFVGLDPIVDPAAPAPAPLLQDPIPEGIDLDTLDDDEIEISNPSEYVETLVTKFNLTGQIKSIIEDIGVYFVDKEDIVWKEFFDYIDEKFDIYQQLHG